MAILSRVARRSAACLAAVVIACAFDLAIVNAALAAPGARVLDVRFGERSPSETRIVVDIEGRPDFVLRGDRGAAGRGRLLIDLSNARGVTARAIKGRGAVGAARLAPSPNGGGLVIAPLRRTAAVKDAFVIPPSAKVSHFRLVVDLADASLAKFLESVEPAVAEPAEAQAAAAKPDPIATVIESTLAPASSPKARKEPELPAQTVAKAAPTPSRKSTARAARDRDGPRVVVIDAGHGGSDPGATGVGGVVEKTITLAAAKSLQAALTKRAKYKVVLTRAADKRLAYQERTRIAREAGADLFISLHADSLSRASVRGASVYTLSEAGTARSAADAEAQGDYVVFDLNIGDADPDVGGILFDLAQRRTGNESERFADLLIDELRGVAPLLKNTHRRGNLIVLLAPDVPAVLLELGFMSNKLDEANLKSPAWRKKTMAAVADAIDAYFTDAETDRRAAAAGRAGDGPSP